MAPAHTMDAGEHVEASSLAAGAEVSTAPQLQLERGSDSRARGQLAALDTSKAETPLHWVTQIEGFVFLNLSAHLGKFTLKKEKKKSSS